MPSGADLEYQRLLAQAGVDPSKSQGYDGAYLEQQVKEFQVIGPGKIGSSRGVTAPLLVATPIVVDTAGTHSILGYNPKSGLYYAVVIANGHYATSPDGTTWTDRTYSPSAYTPNPVSMDFDDTYQYIYSSDGKVWRSPLMVFNQWTEISVPTRGPLTSGRPGSLLVVDNGILLYGNYTSGLGDGSHIWRSTDAGSSWKEVLVLPNGKHVHAIRKSPNTGWVWASLGDAGHEGAGLWLSKNGGVSWTLMSSNDYGIDMVFAPANDRFHDRIILEGDGLNRPLLMGFDERSPVGTKTYPLVWFTGNPSDPASTRGTTRGIAYTPNGDVIFFTTTEGGAVGSKAGLYIAQGPDHTNVVLLKDTTGAEPVGYLKTFVNATTSKVMNRVLSFTLPTFGKF